jgi:hypothetical protein
MTTALSPVRLGAPGAAHRCRSALSHRPGPASGTRNDDPHRMQHGGPLLDDLISGAWENLFAHHSVACPVCGGSMAPRYGSGARPVGGRCHRCGSTLG